MELAGKTIPVHWRILHPVQDWLEEYIVSPVENFLLSIQRVIDYLPVIWNDRDFDAHYMWKLLEVKLRRLSKCIENGHHVGCEKTAKDILVCAHLARRLGEQEYKDEYISAWSDKQDELLSKEIDAGYRCSSKYCGVCHRTNMSDCEVLRSINHQYLPEHKRVLDRMSDLCYTKEVELNKQDFELFCKLLKNHRKWWD